MNLLKISSQTNAICSIYEQQEIITRSGYKYTLHEAIADDGYVTQVTRLINPKADPRFLRQPPILLEHGGTIDPTAYIIASSIQHHPEKWPRTVADGPITSWNRSLAFMLANNGWDVWLAETRGSNDNNKKRVRSRIGETVRAGANARKNMTRAESLDELARANTYWSFSQDDIIAHELKSHMDLVLEQTGSKKLHLFTFSLSTPTSLAFFSIRPDYAAKVLGYVSMAPIVSGEGVNSLIKLTLQTLCPILPDQVGTLLITDMLFTQPMRDLVVGIARSRTLRYSVVKAFITLIMGASAKYQTLLDENVLGHMLRELSFKEAKQLCQQTKANKLQKYDYGPVKNQILYKSKEPPVYDLSKLGIKDWIIISAANDALATPQVVEHLKSLVRPKPIAHLVAPGMNHLDLIAGFDNDKWVNLPVLNYFNKMSLQWQRGASNGGKVQQVEISPDEELIEENQFDGQGSFNPSEEMQASSARRIKTIIQPEVASRMLSDATRTFTATVNNFTRSIQSGQAAEGIQNNIRSFMGAFGRLFQLPQTSAVATNEINQTGY